MIVYGKALHARDGFITTVPNFSERKVRNRNPFPSGVGGIRTLEPYETVNTLAGCPYRPLRHDSEVSTRQKTAGRNLAPHDGLEPPLKVPKTRVLPLH